MLVGLDADAVIDGISQALFAAEVALSGLHRDVPKQDIENSRVFAPRFGSAVKGARTEDTNRLGWTVSPRS